MADAARIPYYCPLLQWLAPAQRGFALIEAVCNVTFPRVTSADPLVATLLLQEGPLPAGQTGQTMLSVNPANIFANQVGIVFAASGINWTDAIRNQTAIHETGHALGLHHATVGPSMMLAQGGADMPQPSDIANLRAIWGPPGGIVPNTIALKWEFEGYIPFGTWDSQKQKLATVIAEWPNISAVQDTNKPDLIVNSIDIGNPSPPVMTFTGTPNLLRLNVRSDWESLDLAAQYRAGLTALYGPPGNQPPPADLTITIPVAGTYKLTKV